MSEWSNVPLSKTGRVNSPRGFESHLRRPSPRLAPILDSPEPTTRLTAKLTAKRENVPSRTTSAAKSTSLSPSSIAIRVPYRGLTAKQTCLSLKYSVELAHRLHLHRWQDMGVSVHGHADLTVAQHLLHHLWMDVQAEQHSRSAMAQIVKTYIWQICLFFTPVPFHPESHSYSP